MKYKGWEKLPQIKKALEEEFPELKFMVNEDMKYKKLTRIEVYDQDMGKLRIALFTTREIYHFSKAYSLGKRMAKMEVRL